MAGVGGVFVGDVGVLVLVEAGIVGLRMPRWPSGSDLRMTTHESSTVMMTRT